MSGYDEIDLRIKFAQLQVQMGALLLQSPCNVTNELKAELTKACEDIKKEAGLYGIKLDSSLCQ